jgi:hypothetical protein
MEKIVLLCVLIAGILAASSSAGIVSVWSSRFKSPQQTSDAPPKRGQTIGARSAALIIISMLSVV